MRIKSITYPTSLDKIVDIENDNIDVFVELENQMKLTFVVTTPKNLLWYMEKEQQEFIEASPPDIIVKSLTEMNIQKALESYAEENAYWLKLYYLVGLGENVFSVKDLDTMIKNIQNL